MNRYEVTPDHPENWPRRCARLSPDLATALEKFWEMVDEANSQFAWREFISEREAMARESSVAEVHLMHTGGGRHLVIQMPTLPRVGEVIDCGYSPEYSGPVESLVWKSANVVEIRLATIISRDLRVEELAITTRSVNVLRCAGLQTVAQLSGLTYRELLDIKNGGRETAREITRALMLLGRTPQGAPSDIRTPAAAGIRP